MIPTVGFGDGDFGGAQVPLYLISGWMMESVQPSPFVPFPSVNTLGDMPSLALPMTMHDRLWQWPPLVGPINIAGGRPQMTATPRELPVMDGGFPTIPMPTWPRGDDPSLIPPMFDQSSTVLPVPAMEQAGMKNVWTRAYPTLPSWDRPTFGGWNGGSNVRWMIEGTTRDGSGAALGGCTVVVMRTEEMAQARDPDSVVVDVEVSDAGGAFSSQVPSNVPHLLVGYKAGTPDLAGVTVNTVAPVEK